MRLSRGWHLQQVQVSVIERTFADVSRSSRKNLVLRALQAVGGLSSSG